MPVLEGVKKFFVGKGSLTDMGERYPILDKYHQTSIKNLFVVGNLAGTPDIRAALNSGYDVARHLISLQDKCDCPVDTEVAILGAGPAGVNCALELKKAGREHRVLERRQVFATIRAFKPDLPLYWAVTGEKDLRGTLPYKETTAQELLKVWDPVVAEHNPTIETGVDVKSLTKLCHFELETKTGVVKAHRVVVSTGKVITLEKMDPHAIEGIDCREAQGEISKEKIASSDVPWEFLRKVGVKRESQWNKSRLLFACLSLLVIGAIYYIGKVHSGDIPTVNVLGFPLGFWDWYSILYTLIVIVFGIKAAMRWNDALQWKKYASLIFFQTVFYCVLPIFILKNWKAFGLAYPWPLALKPHNWDAFVAGAADGGANAFYVFWNFGLTLILMPIIVLFTGKKFCSWACGCGGLAETLGDQWRHFSPKGPANIKRERAIVWVTIGVLIATVMAATNAPGKSWSNWLSSWVFDFALIAWIPIALYPFFGGKIWCRYWCPTAYYMHLFSNIYTKWKVSRYAIYSRKERCIACNMCSRYCEVGIDVKKFAVKGEVLDNSNSSCIGCGICISVCPTETLSHQEWSPPVQLQDFTAKGT